MIQIIGIMIGAYIFTRMLAMATDKQVHAVARVLAVLTMLIDLFCVLMLFATNGSAPPGLR